MRPLVALAFVVAAVPVAAQQKPSDPMGTYRAYLAVLARAETVDQLLPYYTKELATGLSKMPEEMKGNYLRMNRRVLEGSQGIEGVGDRDAGRVRADGSDGGGQPISGKAILVKEDGTWKIDEDAWVM